MCILPVVPKTTQYFTLSEITSEDVRFFSSDQCHVESVKMVIVPYILNSITDTVNIPRFQSSTNKIVRKFHVTQVSSFC